jgi:hypothetical protein
MELLLYLSFEIRWVKVTQLIPKKSDNIKGNIRAPGFFYAMMGAVTYPTDNIAC